MHQLLQKAGRSSLLLRHTPKQASLGLASQLVQPHTAYLGTSCFPPLMDNSGTLADGCPASAKKRKVDHWDFSTTNDGATAAYTTVANFKVPGLVVSDHVFKLPLDHTGVTPGDIHVFVRVLTHPVTNKASLPYLVFLQGGPGFEAPRPTEASAWIKSAVSQFKVVLMDQRGTGKSTPITTNNLKHQGSSQAQADYLSFFRADSIVADCEMIRHRLVPKDVQAGRWSVLGQSFGGFCAATYLSFAASGLTEALITGGLPPGMDMPCSADAVYRETFARTCTQNARYYARFPTDVALVQRIVNYLAAQPGGGLMLPSGNRLAPRGLQLLGLSGLGSGGGFERLHYLLESFFDSTGEITPTFIKGWEAQMPWDANPLYAILHEAIYCQEEASNWSSERIRQQPEYAECFDAVAAASKGAPVYFTAEMVFPWMFEDFAALRPYQEAADLLAKKANWSSLYDLPVLAENVVPVAALSYVEDLYVDFTLAQATAAHIQGIRQWMTNEYKHSGIRDDGGHIFDRLLNMARDGLLQD